MGPAMAVYVPKDQSASNFIEFYKKQSLEAAPDTLEGERGLISPLRRRRRRRIRKRPSGKYLLCLSTPDAINHKLTIPVATQLKNQVSAIVRFRIHRIDQPHLRLHIQMIVIGDSLEQHLRHPIEIRLSNQRHIFRFPSMILGLAREHQGSAATEGEFISLELLIGKHRRRGCRWGGRLTPRRCGGSSTSPGLGSALRCWCCCRNGITSRDFHLLLHLGSVARVGP